MGIIPNILQVLGNEVLLWPFPALAKNYKYEAYVPKSPDLTQQEISDLSDPITTNFQVLTDIIDPREKSCNSHKCEKC